MDEKAGRHMAIYGHTTWQRVGVYACVYACVRASMCARVCASVCTREEKDKLPFQDNVISL